MAKRKLYGVVSLFAGLMSVVLILLSIESPNWMIYFNTSLVSVTLFFVTGLYYCVNVHESNKKFLKFFSIYLSVFFFWFLVTPRGCDFFNGCLLDQEMIIFVGVGTSSVILFAKILSLMLSQNKSDKNTQSVPEPSVARTQKYLFIEILLAILLIVWFLIDW